MAAGVSEIPLRLNIPTAIWSGTPPANIAKPELQNKFVAQLLKGGVVLQNLEWKQMSPAKYWKGFKITAPSLHPEHFHHLVAEVVDDLDGDAARGGFVERAGGVAVQGGPGLLVDLGLEGGLE